MEESSPPSDVVDRVFDRMQRMLPTPVPRLPSMKKAAMVAGILVLLGLYYTSSIPTPHLRVPVGVGIIASSIVAYTQLQDFLYGYDLYVQNRQHFANTMWIPRYMRALVTK